MNYEEYFSKYPIGLDGKRTTIFLMSQNLSTQMNNGGYTVQGQYSTKARNDTAFS